MNFFKKLYTTRTPSTHSLDSLKSDHIREEHASNRSLLESSPSENFLSLKYSPNTKRSETLHSSGFNLASDHGCCTPSRRPSMCLSYAAVVHSVYKSKPSQPEKKEKVLSVREVKLSSNKHIAQVLPGLYLGSKDAAHDLCTLRQFEISHILNVTEEVEVKHADKLVKTLKIPVKDLPNTNMVMHFQVAFDFIDESRFGGKSSVSPKKTGGRNKSKHTNRTDRIAKEDEVFEKDETENHKNDLAEENSPRRSKKFSRSESLRRKSGSVLVHCYYGVSRSATIVAGYLMDRENMLLEDALKYLRIVRPQVKPNDGFIKQLKSYEEALHSRTK